MATKQGSGAGALGAFPFDPAYALPKKRSLTIAGHRSSITLEDAFWDELKHAALEAGLPIAALVAAIDGARGAASLSAAIRVFLLTRLKRDAS